MRGKKVKEKINIGLGLALLITVLGSGCGGLNPEKSGDSGVRSDSPPATAVEMTQCLNESTRMDREMPPTTTEAVRRFSVGAARCSAREEQLKDYARKTLKRLPNSSWQPNP